MQIHIGVLFFQHFQKAGVELILGRSGNGETHAQSSAGNRQAAGHVVRIPYESQLRSGESPLDLLRVEGMYSSFSVTWSAVADGRIQVLATLKYPGNRVEQRLLNLVEQDGGWRIDEITFAS